MSLIHDTLVEVVTTLVREIAPTATVTWRRGSGVLVIQDTSGSGWWLELDDIAMFADDGKELIRQEVRAVVLRASAAE